MERTTPYAELNRNVVGYMVNASLSVDSQAAIYTIQNQLKDKFGELIWSLPVESLHITLMDWVAPLVDYGKDKDELFQEIYKEYNAVLERILQDIGEITVDFTEVRVSQGGVYLTGVDKGQFEQIRKRFLEQITLIPGTKQPPQIIHTTIARFTKEADLAAIKEFVQDLSVSFAQPIKSFHLVKETKVPMLDRDLVKEYLL